MATTVHLVLLPLVLLCCVQTGITQCDVATIAMLVREAVLEVVQPFMNETRAGLEAVKRDLEEDINRIEDNLGQRVRGVEVHLIDINKKVFNTQTVLKRSLNETMTTVNDNIEEFKDQTTSELVDMHTSLSGKMDMVSSRMEFINVSIREEFRAIERQLAEHKYQTTSEINNLHSSLQSTHTAQLTKMCAKVDAMNSKLFSVSSTINDTIDSKLDLLDSKLDMKVMSVNSELVNNILTNVTKQLQNYPHVSLGSCGGEGWTRVAYLDMTDPNTTCPTGWQLTGHSKRTCGKVRAGSLNCDSVFFPVSGGTYTSVCGRVRAYQDGPTDAFEAYDDELATIIDGAYVSGVSITHGSPRQHIWTFAAGDTESEPTRNDACPCDATVDISIPPFVGGDYFCESGVNSGSSSGFHPYDPLWDGKNCTSDSTCCSFNNPPYFTKQLPNPTTDDLEMRLCWYDAADETPIELIELYIGFDELNMRDIEHNVLANVTKELQKISNHLHGDLVIHEHNVLTNVTKQLHNLTEYDEARVHVCGGTGGWRRAVYLDMADPNINCPSGWQLSTVSSKRTCDTGYSGFRTCDSAFFPVSGGAYNRVCGMIRGYQYGHTSAFSNLLNGQLLPTNIDGAYVSGVSITHGSPRQHIWTFAAGGTERNSRTDLTCPCDVTIPTSVPSFVGGDYFCESAVNSVYTDPYGLFFPYDPLWDGKNCTSGSTCCSFNNPPYFTKRLSNPTTDDLEIRQCQWYRESETPIELIDIYVKLDKVDIKEIESNVLSGVREELRRTQENLQKQFGNMNVYVCGGTGGWTRVAYLDMTDAKTDCPSGWQLIRHSKRACGRVSYGTPNCDSVFFPVSRAYTSVCGRIRGYQNNHVRAFETYHSGQVATIDGRYVYGVSVTHGSPRQHIWTFTAGRAGDCPCDSTVNITTPPFVGEDYFCESGTQSWPWYWVSFHPDNPLWDGKNCTIGSSCCSFNNPPYFTKRLPNPTTDDLEVRLCSGTPLDFIEIYVK